VCGGSAKAANQFAVRFNHDVVCERGIFHLPVLPIQQTFVEGHRVGQIGDGEIEPTQPVDLALL
jgi:hypothetical protein